MQKALGVLIVVLGVILSVLLIALTARSTSTNPAPKPSDWMVVQYDGQGQPFNCWKFQGAKFDSHTLSWTNGQTTVGVQGSLAYVQVLNQDFRSAAKQLGVDAVRCNEGLYRRPYPQ